MDWTPEDAALQHLFVDSWRMVDQIAESWGHSAEARGVLGKAESVAPWLRSDPERPARIRLLHTLDEPMIDQFTAALSGETIERLTILSPFLDNAARALAELNSRFQPSDIRLVLQDQRTAGNAEALESLLGKGVPLAIHRLTDDERYLHAKIYIFETRESAYAFTGSANCTRAGLLSTSRQGNLEVMLAHHGVSRQHFAPLVEGHISPHRTESLEEITIVVDPPSPAAAESTGIRLLDVSVADGLLSVVFDLAPSVEGTTGLKLRLSTMPPRSLRLGNYAAGETHHSQSAVPHDLRQPLTRPVSARVEAIDRDGAGRELSSNELWVTNVDALRYEVTRLPPNDERAATNLREVLLTSDEEWRELHECLRRLIALDVQALKKRGGTYTGSLSERALPSARDDSEQRTKVVLVNEQSESRRQDDVAAALFRNSPLHAWLEHVSGRLPGAVSTSQVEDHEPTEPSVPGEGGEKPDRAKWTPSERLGRRFIRLVKKYISSLRNVQYMETASIYHILHYYATFQRIAWLLLEHKVIDTPRFIELVRAMNGGFFGRPEDDAPVLCPTLHRHIRRTYSAEWSTADAVPFALASVNVCEQEIGQVEDEALQREVAEQATRTFAGVAVVANISSLMSEYAEALARVGSTYVQDASSFATKAFDQITDHLPDVRDVLEEWVRATTIALAETGRSPLKEGLQQARVYYGLALYDIISLQGGIEEQSRVCGKLVFWMRLAGYSELAAEWCETLADLLQSQGKGGEAAGAMFHTGIHLLAEGEHEEAVSMMQQASLLAKRLGDEQLHQRCERFVHNIEALFLQPIEDAAIHE